MSENNNPKVALIAAIICIVYVVFVLVFPGVRELPFAQGLTGLIVAATIAVVLFSAVPASAVVKVPIALTGAAAFFFIFLPRIEPFIFPTHTVSGTIYYEGTTQPVPGVEVRDPSTSSSVTTNQNGDFHLPNVLRSLKSLTAKSGGVDYTFNLNEDKKYPIIKRFTDGAKTAPKEIETSAWKEVPRHNCPVQDRSQYPTVKLYMLEKNRLEKVEGFNRLYVRVLLHSEGDILHGETFAPLPDFVHEVNDEQKARQWWTEVTNNDLNLKIAVCVGTNPNVRPPTRDDLKAYYWFGEE